MVFHCYFILIVMFCRQLNNIHVSTMSSHKHSVRPGMNLPSNKNKNKNKNNNNNNNNKNGNEY